MVKLYKRCSFHFITLLGWAGLCINNLKWVIRIYFQGGLILNRIILWSVKYKNFTSDIKEYRFWINPFLFFDTLRSIFILYHMLYHPFIHSVEQIVFFSRVYSFVTWRIRLTAIILHMIDCIFYFSNFILIIFTVLLYYFFHLKRKPRIL